MTPSDIEQVDITRDVRLAEFKALREESLRCAQLLSNAVWVAVTGYTVTIGAGAAYLGRSGAGGLQVKEAFLMPSIMAVLCLEAVAISAMYLSELWKYIRIGVYIREKIEPHFEIAQSAKKVRYMEWECWIQQHRAWELYLGSLAFLQFPIGIAAVGIIVAISFKIGGFALERGSIQEFVSWLISDPILTVLLILIVLIDLAIVLWLLARLLRAEKGQFGRPRVRDVLPEIFSKVTTKAKGAQG